ncbi:hypothetical protein [Pseudomonas sp. NPDC085632]|uniref:hypothetical protein n=1 Tax=Pseudomonas sp. NPDC085632 TaxID=3364429 RepID=UPI0037CB02E8
MLTSGKNLGDQFNRIGRGRFALGHAALDLLDLLDLFDLLYVGAAEGYDLLILVLIL